MANSLDDAMNHAGREDLRDMTVEEIAGATPEISCEDHVYLYAHTKLRSFIHFMIRKPVDAPAWAHPSERRRLADEWRAATGRLREFQESEAGWADGAEVLPIPEDLGPLVSRVEDDPIYQRAFADVPTEIGMVELDRLVVWQETVNLDFARQHSDPPRLGRISDDSFVFISKSRNLRSHGTLLFEPHQLTNFPTSGPIAGLIGVVIGFSTPYLNVISFRGRLALNNGFHRCYALREMGITHVPCAIFRLSGREELGLVGASDLEEDFAMYFESPRPPVFKDYLDPTLTRVITLPSESRHLYVNFSIRSVDVPSG